MSVNPRELSLRDLLENPQLLEVPVVQPFHKEKNCFDDVEEFNGHMAFLGPNLWQKTLPHDLLTLPLESLDTIDVTALLNDFDLPSPDQSSNRRGDHYPCESFLHVKKASVNASDVSNHNVLNMVDSDQDNGAFQCVLMSSDMYDESESNIYTSLQGLSSPLTNASMEVSNMAELENSELLASNSNVVGYSIPISQPILKSIVGDESFDPSRRSFRTEELRVAPILPKSRKIFVPDEKKDDHYWTRRLKNNTAAKRSREARRMKENQITLRTAFLEREMGRLLSELEMAVAENKQLKNRLRRYEIVDDGN